MAGNKEKKLSAAVDMDTIKVNDKGKLYADVESDTAIEEIASNEEGKLAVIGNDGKIYKVAPITAIDEGEPNTSVEFWIGSNAEQGHSNQRDGKLYIAGNTYSSVTSISLNEYQKEDQQLWLPNYIPSFPYAHSACLTCGNINNAGTGSEGHPVYVDKNGCILPCDMDSLAEELYKSLILYLYQDISLELSLTPAENNWISGQGGGVVLEITNTDDLFPTTITNIEFGDNVPVDSSNWSLTSKVTFPFTLDPKEQKTIEASVEFSSDASFGYYDYWADVYQLNNCTRVTINIETG